MGLHLSADSAIGLCGDLVGSLFGDDEQQYELIRPMPAGPGIPPAWLGRHPPPNACTNCWKAAPAYQAKQLEETVLRVLGPRPVHLDPPDLNPTRRRT